MRVPARGSAQLSSSLIPLPADLTNVKRSLAALVICVLACAATPVFAAGGAAAPQIVDLTVRPSGADLARMPGKGDAFAAVYDDRLALSALRYAERRDGRWSTRVLVEHDRQPPGRARADARDLQARHAPRRLPHRDQPRRRPRRQRRALRDALAQRQGLDPGPHRRQRLRRHAGVRRPGPPGDRLPRAHGHHECGRCAPRALLRRRLAHRDARAHDLPPGRERGQRLERRPRARPLPGAQGRLHRSGQPLGAARRRGRAAATALRHRARLGRARVAGVRRQRRGRRRLRRAWPARTRGCGSRPAASAASTTRIPRSGSP